MVQNYATLLGVRLAIPPMKSTLCKTAQHWFGHSVVRCSIQLSYGRKIAFYLAKSMQIQQFRVVSQPKNSVAKSVA
jgi:hypothetical protein